jgi:hypothetical protein
VKRKKKKESKGRNNGMKKIKAGRNGREKRKDGKEGRVESQHLQFHVSFQESPTLAI